MNDLSDRHPMCVHSSSHHNFMGMSDQSSCSCEECARYTAPPQSEQSSAINEMLQQHHANASMDSDSSGYNRNETGTSATTPPTTYLARRTSAANIPPSPKMQPGGYGLGGAASAHMHPHQRRASLEFHNRERSFQQHSTACDCRGSGVGCGCSFTCNC